jgi:Domain of unknown function (DUF4397)
MTVINDQCAIFYFKNLLMKKKFIIVSILFCCACFISCNKDKSPAVFSSAAFIHASPGTPSFQLFIDTLGPVNGSTVAYGSGSGYVGMLLGSRNISFENRTPVPKAVYAQANSDVEGGKAYSYFLYDTLINGVAKILRLTDVLVPPTEPNTLVRFLNLAPNSPAYDVTLVRGTQYDSSSTSTQKLDFVGTDSITIANQAYVGSTPNVDALSPFKNTVTGSTGISIAKASTVANVPSFNRNNRTMIRLKLAGTQTVVFQTATTLLPGRIYTIFARGTAKGQALGVSVIQNY